LQEARATASGRLGRISIGTALDAGAGLVAESVALLKDAGPGLEIELDDGSSTEVLERVRLGGLDVGLLYDYPLAPRELPHDLHAIDLDEAPWQLVMPSAAAAVGQLSELGDRDWCVGLDGPEGDRALRALCAAAGFHPRIRVSTDNRDLVFGLVAAELGVGVVPTLPWRHPAGVTVRAIGEAGATRRTVAVYLRRRTSPALRAAVRAMRVAGRHA
jgi:DNA-binding transcriptional LysR family regulator